ncbi:hypothetical protein PLESTM_001521000 [Pleodorina starrii]|nr:hypothetical protein PLESTM_001521000 [Pleodorina starrii]
MASPGRLRPVVEDRNGRRNATSANANTTGSDRTVQQQQQQAARPAVLEALGRLAGTAWTGIKLCHRYVLAPAAMWALNTLKTYIEEQLAIQRAMTRPCPVPSYSESEVRQATDELSFRCRALGTPYGMVAYLTQLRGASVAVRQVQLSRLQDVDAFWEEAAAGRALLSAGRHAHVVPYVGCCPALACHVYEQCPGAGSLREALLPDSPYGSALGSWEIRVALCRQMISAVVHLLQAGICASELSAAHIILSLGDGDCCEGGDPCRASGSSSSGPANRGPRCWLAPGCGFRLKVEPTRPPAAAAAATAAAAPARQSQPLPRQQQPPSWPGAAAAAQRCSGGGSSGNRRCGGQQPATGDTAGSGAGVESGSGGEEPFVVMGRALGQVLFQLVAGTDSPVPPPSVVLRALADSAPTRLLSPSVKSSVAPPLTEDQAWPLIAAVHTLLNFGGGGGGDGGSGGGGEPSQAAGRSWPGPGRERDRELLGLLVQEVMPVMEDVDLQFRARPGPATPLPAPPLPPPPPPQEDVFAYASAPPLPASPPAWAPASAPPAPSPCGPSVRQGPPEELLCPITQELMEDPVVAADGHSYERAAITRWFAGRQGRATSPMSGAALPHTHLTPNYALRKIIADWRETHGA